MPFLLSGPLPFSKPEPEKPDDPPASKSKPTAICNLKNLNRVLNLQAIPEEKDQESKNTNLTTADTSTIDL